jgi:hypothetical protein
MPNELDGGWIYAMLSSSDYNRFKLGKTTLNPVSRWKGLRTADPTLGFLAAYFVPEALGTLSAIETDIHNRLEGRKSINGRPQGRFRLRAVALVGR